MGVRDGGPKAKMGTPPPPMSLEWESVPHHPQNGGGGVSVAAGVGGGSSELELGKWGGAGETGGGVPEPEWGEPLGEHEVWDGKGSPRPEWADPPSYRIWAVKSLPQTPNMEDPPPTPETVVGGVPYTPNGGVPLCQVWGGKGPTQIVPPHPPPQQNPGFGVGNAPPPPKTPKHGVSLMCAPPPPRPLPPPQPTCAAPSFNRR